MIGCVSSAWRSLKRILIGASVVLAVIALHPNTASASDLEERDAAAIRLVIERQIEAFKKDDANAAYAFAAPEIKDLFPSPEAFIAMVRQGYPPVYRPRSYEFGELGWLDDQLIQPVSIVGPDGVLVTAAYTMERQSDGTWKISGCMILPASGKSI